jgi:hypothetical protein
VVARIIATNSVGDSLPSPDGSETNLMTNPDTVMYLREDLSARTASTIGLQWDDGANNGGGSIIAYQISQAEVISGGMRMLSQSEYEVLFSVFEKSAVVYGLTFGTTYKFVV